MNTADIRAMVEREFDELVAVRRDLHMHPELSGQEVRTSKAVCAYLDKIGVEYIPEVAGQHGIIAYIGKKDAKYGVALRADMDALPVLECTGLSYASVNKGVMHACGHDIHTTTLLGVAKVLKSMESELKGAVKLFFQPAEEAIGGAKNMVEFDGLDKPKITRVIGMHVDPTVPTGCIHLSKGRMNASTTEMTITINGVACHGAHPDQGIDSIVVAAHVVLALQAISSRFTSPTTPVIVTIGTINGGTKENVCAGQVVLRGTIRALDFETRDYVKSRVKTIAETTAAAFGATAEVQLNDGYPPLVNDEATALAIADECEKAFGHGSVVFMEEPSLGADDFAYFSSKVPGVYYNLGTYTEGQVLPQALHNEHFTPDEECIKYGVLLNVLGTLRFLDEDEPKA